MKLGVGTCEWTWMKWKSSISGIQPPSYRMKHDPMSEGIIFPSNPIKEQTPFSLRTSLLTCFKFIIFRFLLFSHSVVFVCDHGLYHARLSCPSVSPGICSNSYSLSWWCPPTISSSVVPFSTCPQYWSHSVSALLCISSGNTISVFLFRYREFKILICCYCCSVVNLFFDSVQTH